MIRLPRCTSKRGSDISGAFAGLRRAASGVAMVASVCLLALALEGPKIGRADDKQPAGLTKEDRQQLERRAAELNDQAVQLYQEGKYPTATKLLEEALAMRRRLYPTDKYPQGHPDLAESLDNLGGLLQVQGEYARAFPYHEQALAMFQRLYPEDMYPQGHPALATSLNNLGALLQVQGEYARAMPYNEQGLAMRLRLYPKDKYPQGHPDLAASLNNLGFLLQAQGEYARALPYKEQALAMYQRLYPKEKYPQGHPDLATSLNNLGALLQAQGEYARALPSLEQALAMRQRLYPKDKYPQGHPDLALSLNNLGALLQAQGEYARALPYKEQALAMYQRVYSTDKYPQGQPDLALSLNNLGFLLEAQGEYARALSYYQQALAMRQRLYPTDKYPHGHPALALSLNNMGTLLEAQGEYARALPYFEQALAMKHRLYPKEKVPEGHPDLARSLNNLGALLQAQGEYARALPYYEQGLAMYHDLTEVFLAGASEAEAFSLAASLPLTRDSLLSVSRELAGTDDQSYRHIWRGKAAISRILQRRQEAVLAGSNPESRKACQELQDTRRALARLLLHPAPDPKIHRQRLQELSETKERLERELAANLPEFRRQKALERLSAKDLVQKLPPGTVFIDFLRYVHFRQDPKVPGQVGEKRTPSYVAFLLLATPEPLKPRSGSITRVELGPAAPIEAAVADWRRAIAGKKPSAAAEELRRLVWQPLVRHLPADTQRVLIAPDAALSILPWAALPGRKNDTVLLEDYALAMLPHGPFLLDRLTALPNGMPPPGANAPRSAGLFLAVGGVSYDQEPSPVTEAKEDFLMQRSAERGDQGPFWRELAGTLEELDQVVPLAGSRLVRRLSGREASTARLFAALPKAQWVHLATHGFFAEARYRSVLQIDEKLFERRAFGEGPAPGARNPLVLSGIVLAGANLPIKDILHDDGGILTAEAIAGLPLQNLELAVLSACETGLGEVAGGEGVFGLQRAFHMAGAHNVIASLWTVDDQATAALMGLFYDKFWRQNKPPIVALREAQLTLYHHPERIPALAKVRGLEKLPTGAAKDGEKPDQNGKAPVKLWAGFEISGLGQ